MLEKGLTWGGVCITDVCVKADLHGTILAYDCRMRSLLRALLASLKNRMRFPRYQIA